MLVRAVCCASFRRSVQRAAGVEPLLSPPLTVENFQPSSIEGYDLLYFKLHGIPRQPFWYGDVFTTAISADQVRQADLSKTAVFVANCHLYQVQEGKIVYEPMLQALKDAGARAVIGGPGSNFAGRTRVFGADLLGLVFREALTTGASLADAFHVAKARLRIGNQDRVTRDTLEFKMFV